MPDAPFWSIAMPHYAAALAIGYLIGSVPFGLVLTRLSGAGDIRTIGSGNIGATNVLRTGRKGLAALTLLGDALKGTAAVILLAAIWGRNPAIAAGFGAFLGHVFPVWLRFKGGKGVATFLGVILGLAWPVALVFAAVWLATAALTRYSSLAGLIATAAAPVALWAGGDRLAAQVVFVMAVMVWIFHHANIRRLARGMEPRIGKSAAPAADSR